MSEQQQPKSDFELEYEHDPSLKEEYTRILTDLRENPLSINVEKSQYLYHPSDYIDSRIGVGFIGEYGVLAGLMTEFWNTTTIAPFVIVNPTKTTAEQQLALLATAVKYEQGLQQVEIDQYRVKMESSPLGMNLSNEEVDEKIDGIIAAGDKSRLLINSKTLSTNDFIKIESESNDAAELIKALSAADPENKIKLIIFVGPKDNAITFSHPSIPTITPELPEFTTATTNWSDNAELEQFSAFIQNLPDVLQLFV